MHPLPFRSSLARSCEQSDNFILRALAVAGGIAKQFAERSSTRVIHLGCRTNSSEWLDRLLPRIIQLRPRDLSLTGQDLPDSNSCLKGAEGVATHRMGKVIQRFSRFQKQDDGCVAQFRKFGKNSVLVAKLLELARQQTHSRWGKSMFGSSSVINFADRHENLKRPNLCGRPREPKHRFNQTIWTGQAIGASAPCAHET